MRKLNWQKIIHDTYVELYENAEPQANFDKLVENSTVNSRGEKVIPFNDYEISEHFMSDILYGFMKRYKMNKHNREAYSISIYLGCSPKTKLDD